MKLLTSAVAVGLLACCGCVSFMDAGHPDSTGPEWEDVFNHELSNAECAKPGWAWDKDGYLTPGTGETLFSKKDYANFVIDIAYFIFAQAVINPKVEAIDSLDSAIATAFAWSAIPTLAITAILVAISWTSYRKRVVP